jgi:creatinine amidohydrolase
VKTRRFADETARRVDPSVVLAVALGATEQHGPHLPLSTDTIVAEALVDTLCAANATFRFGPTFAVGASGEHAGFPGTLSLGTEALTTVLIELVRSARDSCRAVYFVSGHGGNYDAVARALAVSTREGDRVGAFFSGVQGGDVHAGRTETSLLLHLAPHLVVAPFEVGNVAPFEQLQESLKREGTRAVSPNGILGDPTGASAKEGAQLFAQMSGRLIAHATTWLGEAS